MEAGRNAQSKRREIAKPRITGRTTEMVIVEHQRLDGCDAGRGRATSPPVRVCMRRSCTGLFNY
jgi:hypothetical protein